MIKPMTLTIVLCLSFNLHAYSCNDGDYTPVKYITPPYSPEIIILPTNEKKHTDYNIKKMTNQIKVSTPTPSKPKNINPEASSNDRMAEEEVVVRPAQKKSGPQSGPQKEESHEDYYSDEEYHDDDYDEDEYEDEDDTL